MVTCTRNGKFQMQYNVESFFFCTVYVKCTLEKLPFYNPLKFQLVWVFFPPHSDCSVYVKHFYSV